MPSTDERPGCLSILLPFLRREHSQAERYPYRLRPSLLSPAELSFYKVLERALEGDFAIFAKVRLADILLVENKKKKLWLFQSHFAAPCGLSDLRPRDFKTPPRY